MSGFSSRNYKGKLFMQPGGEPTMRKTIVISAGHYPEDPGVCANDLVEYNVAEAVVHRLSFLLRSGGYLVVKVSGRLTEKIRNANEDNPDAAVEIHFNGHHDPTSNGIECLYGSNPKDRELAEHIQKRLVTRLGLDSRGVKFADYQGTPDVIDECAFPRLIGAPAVIVEPCFMSNPKEAELLKDSSYLYKIATAVFEGIRDFLDDGPQTEQKVAPPGKTSSTKNNGEDMNDLTKKLIEAGEKIAESWKEKLADGKISVTEIFGLVSTMVIVAEGIVGDAKAGHIKHAAVKDAFSYFDRKYKIIKRLDDMIELPWWIEPFDAKLMRAAVDFLIGQAVEMMNTLLQQKFSEDEGALLDEHHTGEEVADKNVRPTRKANFTMDKDG